MTIFQLTEHPIDVPALRARLAHPEARAKCEILDAVIVHRVGHLQVGDLAVWIGVTAAHRNAAFTACRFLIEELNQRLPVWKKERYTNGQAGWIGA